MPRVEISEEYAKRVRVIPVMELCQECHRDSWCMGDSDCVWRDEAYDVAKLAPLIVKAFEKMAEPDA